MVNPRTGIRIVTGPILRQVGLKSEQDCGSTFQTYKGKKKNGKGIHVEHSIIRCYATFSLHSRSGSMLLYSFSKCSAEPSKTRVSKCSTVAHIL